LLDAERLQGIGALYGCLRPAGDVLDLGCGTGVQLVRLGDQMRGRLVGVDLSAEAIALAKSRCSRFGGRVQIQCADFLDLAPESLGQFDLIYHIGVIYVTPTDVQAHILRLIGQCLRPGGVAVISYYTGALSLLRASLHATLKATVEPGASRQDQIASARQTLAAMASRYKSRRAPDPLVISAFEQTAQTGDVVFYHEVLNQAFDVLSATTLHQALAEHGLGFLTYAAPTNFADLPTARERALVADMAEFALGGYRHALFGKFASDSEALDARSVSVRWRTGLARSSGRTTYDGPAVFSDPASGLDATVTRPATQALLDELSDRPQSWPSAYPAALRRLPTPASPDDRTLTDTVTEDLLALWRQGLATPLPGEPSPAAKPEPWPPALGKTPLSRDRPHRAPSTGRSG
jgi:SAM-dependent methyltransferase